MKNATLPFLLILFFLNASFLSAQNVGINTIDPQTALHVADDNIATGGVTIGTGTVGDGGNLRLLSNTNHWNLDNSFGALRFFSETGFGTGGIERFRINADGRAGFTETFPDIGLNVTNISTSNPIILNVRGADGNDRFQVLENGSTVMNGSTVINGSTVTNGSTLMNGRVATRQHRPSTSFNIQGQFPEIVLLNVELSNGTTIFQVQADQDVAVVGDLFVTNGSKNFITDHPLDPANKSLRHSCIESPEVLNVYSGTVLLDAQGKGQVELPDYFEALNKDFRYQLTCLGGYAPVFIQKEVENNHFEIAGGTPGLKISWQVTGVRNDPWFRDHPYQAVEEKTGREKGRYYYPEGYGMPREMSIGRMEDTESEMEPLKIEDN